MAIPPENVWAAPVFLGVLVGCGFIAVACITTKLLIDRMIRNVNL